MLPQQEAESSPPPSCRNDHFEIRAQLENLFLPPDVYCWNTARKEIMSQGVGGGRLLILFLTSKYVSDKNRLQHMELSFVEQAHHTSRQSDPSTQSNIKYRF